jgi:Icc-related predicted phosphoesterase
MVKFLYVTDLHGWELGYNEILTYAIKNKFNTIINGGDILPKDSNFFINQKIFITTFLKNYFKTCHENGIKYYTMFGNDDLKCHIPLWKSIINKDLEIPIDLTSFNNQATHFENNLKIIGFNLVPDHPFGLKDWCRLDYSGWQRPLQYSNQDFISNLEAGKLVPIEDKKKYFEQQTIEEELNKLKSEDWSRTIVVCHCPPKATQLGNTRCSDVGSGAILKWINREQPLLTLHGHIHESPAITGVFKMNVNKTVCIQPGQNNPYNTIFSEVEIHDDFKIIARRILLKALKI